ncbi:hypothetical protein FO519_000128 [Halicephalobus sp. NKZ332]|nr:hypothetical protein FO519_000128 [Halicephalobus sp. NKZ332]
MNAIQQYVMLMNQQQQEAANIQPQQPPQTPMSANALLFNALNRGDQQQQLALAALQSPSVDLANAALALNERRASAPFLQATSVLNPNQIRPQQLGPTNQPSPMMSPLLQAVQQQQHQQVTTAANDQISPLNAFSNLPSNLLQANIISEIQREVQRQQQQAVAQQQQFQQLHQVLQQANLPPAQAHQLLAAIQQQQHVQNQAQNPNMFGGGQLRPQHIPVAPIQRLPQASPLISAAPGPNLNQLNGVRFLEDAAVKKLSQPQLPTIPPSPIPGSSTSAQNLPKRPSFSAQPNPRKPSITTPQIQRPIPTPLRPTIGVSSGSTLPGPSNPAPVPPMHTGLPEQPYYPTHFMRGTSIKLETGELRLIEEMKPEDFKKSALLTPDLRVMIGEIVDIKSTNCCRNIVVQYKIDLDGYQADGCMTASAEYPFYEAENGWSSFDPEKTLNLYGLKCRQLAIGDKCIVLSRDFPEREDEELKKKWQSQFQSQYQEFKSKLEDASKDDPMDGSSVGNGNGRLVRKSIPPPLAMFGGQESSNHLSISQQPNRPISSSQRTTSDSGTPLTSTISAPADSFQMKQSFSLATPNEPYSAPADLAVAQEMSRRPLQGQDQTEDQPGTSTNIPPIARTSESEVFHDFSI